MEAAQITVEPLMKMLKRFSDAMDNDLGTPDALAVIFESINEGNALLDSKTLMVRSRRWPQSQNC